MSGGRWVCDDGARVRVALLCLFWRRALMCGGNSAGALAVAVRTETDGVAFTGIQIIKHQRVAR